MTLLQSVCEEEEREREMVRLTSFFWMNPFYLFDLEFRTWTSELSSFEDFASLENLDARVEKVKKLVHCFDFEERRRGEKVSLSRE